MMTAMKRVLALVMALGLLFALPAGLQAEELTYQNFTIQLKNGQLFVTQGNAAYYEDTFTSVPPSFGLFTATDDYETLVLTYEKDGQRIFVRLPAAGDVLLDGAFPEVIFAAEITDVRLDLETGATIDTLNAAAPLMLELRGNVKTLNVSGDVELTLLGSASAQGTTDLTALPHAEWSQALLENAAGTMTITVDWTKPIDVKTTAFVVPDTEKPARDPATKCRICGSTKHTRPKKLACGHYQCRVKKSDKTHENKLTCGEYECQVKNKDDAMHTQKQPCGHYLCAVKDHEKEHAVYACGKHYVCGDSKAESHMNCEACGKPLCEGDHSHKKLDCGHVDVADALDHRLLPCGKHFACAVTDGAAHLLCTACGKGLCEGDHKALACGLHYICATQDGPGHAACGTCGKPLCNGDDHTKCKAPEVTPAPTDTPVPTATPTPTDTAKPEETTKPEETPGTGDATPSEA